MVSMNRMGQRAGAVVLGSMIDHLTYASAVDQISSWAERHESRYVCICNVHSIVAARHDSGLREAIESADMATADGMPVAFVMRKSGFPDQQRICGPDLMLHYCRRAEQNGQSIFLYGSTDQTLMLLKNRLREWFPSLRIAGDYSPPFGPISHQEDLRNERRIKDSGAQVVFVGLGCPKQEKWMRSQKGRINAVMIGVGAAFDFHAGTVKRAPEWMQQYGLEWLYRFLSEPRRLWKRYLTTNSLFLIGVIRQLYLK
jgi:N-acetylglucosaminyldiphosphoundecaprenol N-acetyl-beta-D-mannosaminyltransferase